jgi:hypothetical protein
MTVVATAKGAATAVALSPAVREAVTASATSCTPLGWVAASVGSAVLEVCTTADCRHFLAGSDDKDGAPVVTGGWGAAAHFRGPHCWTGDFGDEYDDSRRPPPLTTKKTARMWALNGGTGRSSQVRTFEGYSGWVTTSVCITADDGRHLLTGSSDKTARRRPTRVDRRVVTT